MLHEAIFLATCNLTNVALQVARKKSRPTPHFATAIICYIGSCKKSRTTLYFLQRSETSCLRVTSPQQLATQFCQNGPIRANLSLAGDFRHLVCYCMRCKLRKKLQTCNTPSARFFIRFLFVIVALQVARKIASCNMALSSTPVFGCYHLMNSPPQCSVAWFGFVGIQEHL